MDSSQPNQNPINNQQTPPTGGTDQPPQPAPTVMGPPPPNVGTFSDPGKPPKKNLFKRLGRGGTLGLVAVLLLAGSAAAYFGYIVPNQPENVWKRALSNTATGYDMLLEYADTQEEAKGARVDGSLAITGEVAGDGNFDFTAYENDMVGTIDVGLAGSRYKAELRGTVPENASTPDLYLKFDGIGSLAGLIDPTGQNPIASEIQSLDGQWVFIDHTLFDQLVATASQEEATPELSNEEAMEIARAFGEVNRQYLFSTEEGEAVFTVAEQVGKEDFEGRSSYHYKVGINKDNLVAYTKALKDRLGETKLKEVVGEEAFNRGLDDMIKSAEELKVSDDDTVDVWVDMGTKLVRNVRLYQEDDNKYYTDIRLDYTGGDVYPFIITGSDESGGGTISFTLDAAQDKVTFDAEVEATEGTPFKMDLTMNIQPHEEPVNVEVPENTKPFNDVLSLFMGGAATDTQQSQLSPEQTVVCAEAYEAWANSNGQATLPEYCGL